MRKIFKILKIVKVDAKGKVSINLYNPLLYVFFAVCVIIVFIRAGAKEVYYFTKDTF